MVVRANGGYVRVAENSHIESIHSFISKELYLCVSLGSADTVVISVFFLFFCISFEFRRRSHCRNENKITKTWTKLTLLKRDKRRRSNPDTLPATSESLLPVPHNPRRSRCSLILLVLCSSEQLSWKLFDEFVVCTRRQHCCCGVVIVVEQLQILVGVPFDGAYTTVSVWFMRSPFDCLADWYDEWFCCACAQPPLKRPKRKRERKMKTCMNTHRWNCVCVWMKSAVR